MNACFMSLMRLEISKVPGQQVSESEVVRYPLDELLRTASLARIDHKP